MSIKKLESYFQYLDDLRESGDKNMFGARRYLIEQFSMPDAEARDVLKKWMKTYYSKKTISERAKIAMEKTNA